MLSKIKLIVGAALLALALAVPGTALAHSHRGNHCGRAHAKHARAVGKTCQKQKRHGTDAQAGTVGTGNTAGDNTSTTQNEPADEQNEAQDQNEGADEQNEANDEQNEAQEQQNGAQDQQNGNAANDDGDGSGHDCGSGGSGTSGSHD